MGLKDKSFSVMLPKILNVENLFIYTATFLTPIWIMLLTALIKSQPREKGFIFPGAGLIYISTILAWTFSHRIILHDASPHFETAVKHVAMAAVVEALKVHLATSKDLVLLKDPAYRTLWMNTNMMTTLIKQLIRWCAQNLVKTTHLSISQTTV